MTEYDKVVAGERVKAFLADEYVQEAFKRIESKAMLDFKTAKDDVALRQAQALCRVTDAFAGLLVQMVEEGQLARNVE